MLWTNNANWGSNNNFGSPNFRISSATEHEARGFNSDSHKSEISSFETRFGQHLRNSDPSLCKICKFLLCEPSIWLRFRFFMTSDRYKVIFWPANNSSVGRSISSSEFTFVRIYFSREIMIPVFITLLTAVLCWPTDNPLAQYLRPDAYLDCP